MTQTDENMTEIARLSDRETMISRRLKAPARIVWEAWVRPELFRQWWVPRSFGLTLLSCEMDVRVGGAYRLVFAHPMAEEPMAFFGHYLEVAQNSRLVWTNEEGEEVVETHVTFAETEGTALVTIRNLYPSQAALDAEIASGATSCMGETLDQLATLVAERLNAAE